MKVNLFPFQKTALTKAVIDTQKGIYKKDDDYYLRFKDSKLRFVDDGVVIKEVEESIDKNSLNKS